MNRAPFRFSESGLLSCSTDTELAAQAPLTQYLELRRVKWYRRHFLEQKTAQMRGAFGVILARSMNEPAPVTQNGSRGKAFIARFGERGS
jgi:hypothetical protein